MTKSTKVKSLNLKIQKRPRGRPKKPKLLDTIYPSNTIQTIKKHGDNEEI